MTSPKEILLKAAELIETHGHHKGSYRSSEGAYCIAGAVLAAIDPTARHSGALCDRDMNVYDNLLYRLDVGLNAEVIAWNDRPVRTAREVTERLCEIAAGLSDDA